MSKDEPVLDNREPIKVISLKELLEWGEKERERLSKLVYIEDDSIIFIVDGTKYYYIELSRCNTKGKILEWTHHLLGKRWITLETLERFIDLVSHHFKIELYMED